MKRILAIVALIVAASPLALSQTAQSQSGQATSSGQQGIEQELIRLEREAVQALIKRDISVLESFTAEDYTGTSPSGMFYTRAQALDSVTSGDYALESAELDDTKVRVYGDTAVLTGRSTEKSRYTGSFSFRRWHKESDGCNGFRAVPPPESNDLADIEAFHR